MMIDKIRAPRWFLYIRGDINTIVGRLRDTALTHSTKSIRQICCYDIQDDEYSTLVYVRAKNENVLGSLIRDMIYPGSELSLCPYSHEEVMRKYNDSSRTHSIYRYEDRSRTTIHISITININRRR